MEFLLTPNQISLISSRFASKNIIKEFLIYVKKPVYILEESTMTLKERLFYIKQLLKFKLCAVLVLIPFMILAKKVTGADSFHWNDSWTFYFSIVLIAPILEELVFRNALKYSRVAIAIAIGLILRMICKNFITQPDYIPTAIGLCFLSIPFIAIALKYVDSALKNLWINNFHFIFHAVAIIFGLVHLSNYDHINNYFLAIPLIASQVISGYVLGFIKMKFGILYSISLHSTWNFITSIVFLITLITKLF